MPRRIDALLLAGLVGLPAAAPAATQGRDLEIALGQWWSGGRSSVYSVRSTSPLGDAFTHGLAAEVIIHDSLGRNRAFYGAGYEIQAMRRRGPLSPYLVGGVLLGLSTDTTSHELGALWSLGGGLELRPLAGFAVSLEARYRFDDRGPRGFWRARDDARGGFGAAVAVAIGFGGAGAAGRGGPRAAPPTPPTPPTPPLSIRGNAAGVVQTALDAIGTPYRWGGTADNGFDCSGLIQYAYGRHGIALPRTSRAQARVGELVTPVADALQPGDILLFAAQPGGGVSHVGMFVGEGKFIHSSTSGVRLSRLDSTDPDGSWWVTRWVGARRVIPAF